jgi:Glycosyl hydrolases family 43
MTLKLNEIRMRDPFILETGNLYYLYGTTDDNLWGGPATGFDYYTSKDFENWEGPYPAFRPSADFWSDTQYWAPEVHEYSGYFFMFATFATSDPNHKVRGTAVLKSDFPAGPFQPWSDGPVTPVNLPCLDGTFFVDEEKQPWIIYSRGAEGSLTAKGIDDGEMYAAKLTGDLKQVASEPQLLFTSKSASWSKPLWFPPGVEPPAELGLAENPYFTDGPFLFHTPNGSLKMIWSAFGDAGYAIGVASSMSGKVTGPWKQEDSPLWAENGGHGMILRRSNGTNYLTFHAPNETPHERVQLVELKITDNGVNIVK